MPGVGYAAWFNQQYLDLPFCIRLVLDAFGDENHLAVDT
jgi:hypothetical protein